MKGLRRCALTKPILFIVVLILLWSLLSVITYPLHFLFPDGEIGQLLGESAAKTAICAGFLVVLWRLGWLELAGLTRWGDRRSRLLASVAGIYLIFVEVYVFTGDPAPPVAHSPLAMVQLWVTLPGALLEELLFRALILTTLVLAWGHSRRGIAKSVIVSSFLFGMMHLVNLIVTAPGLVLLQAVVVSLPGVLYGVLVLAGGSLWPAVVIHWLTNAAVNVKIAETGGWEESGTMWVLFALFLIPTTAFSGYMLLTQPLHHRRNAYREGLLQVQSVSDEERVRILETEAAG